MDVRDVIRSFEDARRTLDRFSADEANAERIVRVAAAIAERLQRGGKVLSIGNGGSLTQAMHLCEELTGRFRADRRPLAAVACTDGGHMTCAANDYGFESIFERWVEALVRTDDVLVVFSTSGNSENVNRACRAARSAGAMVVGVLGKGGGEAAQLCDEWWDAPGDTSDRVQEVHLVVLHGLIEAVESIVLAADAGE